jgi:hypothetical protein
MRGGKLFSSYFSGLDLAFCDKILPAMVPEIYLNEMHKRFGFLATWLPNATIAVGDVGFLRRDTLAAVNDPLQTFHADSSCDPAPRFANEFLVNSELRRPSHFRLRRTYS